MAKFNVKITGPSMEIYQYLRQHGYGIKEAKHIAKEQPSSLNFKTFDEFIECVKWFHHSPFTVEANCDFEYDVDTLSKVYIPTEEEIKLAEEIKDETHLNNIEMINAIVYWQKSKDVHPLTCGNDSNHGLLFPGIDEETNTVVLSCPNCNYVQRFIPEIVFEHYKKNLKIKENGTSENNTENSDFKKRC